VTVSTTDEEQGTGGGVLTSYRDAPTRTVAAGGVDFAYRELGPKAGVPVIFLVHLAGNLDNWDPRVVDGIAAKHRVITFDNRGVGASTGKTPDTIEAMAKDAVTFIRALGLIGVGLADHGREHRLDHPDVSWLEVCGECACGFRAVDDLLDGCCEAFACMGKPPPPAHGV
jgi:hypothetical protein